MSSLPKLSVVIPVYNEEKTISEIIRRVLKQKQVSEIIIVDDGSTDGTSRKLKSIKNPRIKYIRHTKNKGKGAAIKTALERVTGDYIIIQDADLEYDPGDYPALLEPVKSGKAEVVYGSRFLGPHKDMLFWNYFANTLLNLLVNILYDTTISDCESCYKLFPAKLLKSLDLSSRKFDIEIEMTCKILKKGIRVYEVPVSYSGREYSEGKKIRLSDGIMAFIKVLAYRI